MAKKFYAVQQGKVPGVYRTWEECKEQVHGYSGAVYKSFPTAEEAMSYVMGDSNDPLGMSVDRKGRSPDLSKKSAGQEEAERQNGMGNSECQAIQNQMENSEYQAIQNPVENDRGSEDRLLAYVDGSYYNATGEFSYGVVILQNGSEYCFQEKLSDPELASMHNVAGEIKGAEAAMRYAVEHGYSQITIYHDYEGIARWCTGDWKANKSGTRAYKAYYDSISDRLEVHFVKVKGHSGDKYNDMADRLARQALGL